MFGRIPCFMVRIRVETLFDVYDKEHQSHKRAFLDISQFIFISILFSRRKTQVAHISSVTFHFGLYRGGGRMYVR